MYMFTILYVLIHNHLPLPNLFLYQVRMSPTDNKDFDARYHIRDKFKSYVFKISCLEPHTEYRIEIVARNDTDNFGKADLGSVTTLPRKGQYMCSKNSRC
jgi:hypothetical protein